MSNNYSNSKVEKQNTIFLFVMKSLRSYFRPQQQTYVKTGVATGDIGTHYSLLTNTDAFQVCFHLFFYSFAVFCELFLL